MNNDELLQLVKKFRFAIDCAKENGDFAMNRAEVRFCNFPNGCCDDASELLGYYLEQNGLNDITEVTGHYYGENMYDENKCDHVWLMINDIIIDITGDQNQFNIPTFFNYNIPVYVGKEDKFHKLFEDIKETPYWNFNYANNIDCKKRFDWLYKVICKYL